jgi:hypothetical protein
MLPGFTGHAVESSHVVRDGAHQGIAGNQGVALAGIPAPGCTIECYCSFFTYKCYERCNGRITRSWDNGWCISFGW